MPAGRSRSRRDESRISNDPDEWVMRTFSMKSATCALLVSTLGLARSKVRSLRHLSQSGKTLLDNHVAQMRDLRRLT